MFEPAQQGRSQSGVVALAVVQELAGVDQSLRCDRVAGGPGVPGVECGDGHFGCGEAPVEVFEFLGELSLSLGVLEEPGVFGAEVVALVEEGLGAAGEFAERGFGGRDFFGGVGEFVAGGAPVETAAGGEVVFGVAVSLPRCGQVLGDRTF